MVLNRPHGLHKGNDNKYAPGVWTTVTVTQKLENLGQPG